LSEILPVNGLRKLKLEYLKFGFKHKKMDINTNEKKFASFKLRLFSSSAQVCFQYTAVTVTKLTD